MTQKKIKRLGPLALWLLLGAAPGRALAGAALSCANPEDDPNLFREVTVTNQTDLADAEWRKKLTPEQYQVLRRKSTEQPFTGKYYHNKTRGIYRCAGCGAVLFVSDTKYDSGSGWPSFWKPADSKAVHEETDASHGMVRTEVVCSKCGGHLGHLFEDGPNPTGLRYCINSLSLEFEADQSGEKK
jgi:peptide-methionine (R)-S-oxide reductase